MTCNITMNASKARLRSCYFKTSVIRSYDILKDYHYWFAAAQSKIVLIGSMFIFITSVNPKGFFFLEVLSVKLNSRQNNHSMVFGSSYGSFF